MYTGSKQLGFGGCSALPQHSCGEARACSHHSQCSRVKSTSQLHCQTPTCHLVYRILRPHGLRESLVRVPTPVIAACAGFLHPGLADTRRPSCCAEEAESCRHLAKQQLSDDSRLNMRSSCGASMRAKPVVSWKLKPPPRLQQGAKPWSPELTGKAGLWQKQRKRDIVADTDREAKRNGRAWGYVSMRRRTRIHDDA